MLKKPRLQHTGLAHSDLTPKERQHEQIRQWLANEQSDPARALEIKEQNITNKQIWRKCKREETEKTQQTVCPSTQGNPPKKCRQASPTEALCDIAGPSDSMHTLILIDSVLLNQEASIVTGTLHLMCDVKVMVNIPDFLIYLLSPPYIQTPPSPTLSVLTDLDSCDLSMPIIGSQVHEQSETVQWCDGSTIILPCIIKDGINICQEDANAVSFLCHFQSPSPRHHKYHPSML
jgi:hypothetical protein